MGSNKICDFFRVLRAYNQIINNGFHIFGAQPLRNGRDLCNFQMRNVICVFNRSTI
jgi:hypothetical protein